MSRNGIGFKEVSRSKLSYSEKLKFSREPEKKRTEFRERKVIESNRDRDR